MTKCSDKEKRNSTIHVTKTKALISFAVTAKLICVFVFAYSNCWFSHAKVHIQNQRHSCAVILQMISAFVFSL